MKENDNILLLLQDIKDMLMDLGIMIASLLVAALLGSLLGVFAFWIAVILAVAGLGVVCRAGAIIKPQKNRTERRFPCLLPSMNETALSF